MIFSLIHSSFCDLFSPIHFQEKVGLVGFDFPIFISPLSFPFTPSSYSLSFLQVWLKPGEYTEYLKSAAQALRSC